MRFFVLFNAQKKSLIDKNWSHRRKKALPQRTQRTQRKKGVEKKGLPQRAQRTQRKNSAEEMGSPQECGEIFLDTDFTDYTADEARGREMTGMKKWAHRTQSFHAPRGRKALSS